MKRVLHNDRDEDLDFVDVYWRDSKAALDVAAQAAFPRGPIFFFSTPPTPYGDLHLGHLLARILAPTSIRVSCA
ncbi:hypothetical protein [Mesorhizobium prunaredense]|uniref:hypothetical protein n=1 Tax=Mesorhizobium prunaredense TaxID=1631249 RepID=UPI001FCCDA7D|nr:hypothetical protein [Mesorhizobium prunaredense]